MPPQPYEVLEAPGKTWWPLPGGRGSPRLTRLGPALAEAAEQLGRRLVYKVEHDDQVHAGRYLEGLGSEQAN